MRKTLSRSAALFMACGTLSLAAPVSAELPVYVEVVDADGRRLEGPAAVSGLEGTFEGLSFLHRWGVALDPASGLPTGKARMERLEVTLPLSSATPVFARAMTRNDPLREVVFHFLRPGSGGLEEIYQLALADVTVVRRQLRLADVLSPAGARREAEETLSLIYDREIEVRQVRYLPGDTNGDLELDISDAILLLGYLFLGSSIRCPRSGNVNRDTGLDISDPIAILEYLFGSGRPPPAPFPDCGEAPAGSAIPCNVSTCA